MFLIVIYDRLHPVRIDDRLLPIQNGDEDVLVNGKCRPQQTGHALYRWALTATKCFESFGQWAVSIMG